MDDSIHVKVKIVKLDTIGVRFGKINRDGLSLFISE